MPAFFYFCVFALFVIGETALKCVPNTSNLKGDCADGDMCKWTSSDGTAFATSEGCTSGTEYPDDCVTTNENGQKDACFLKPADNNAENQKESEKKCKALDKTEKNCDKD